jgi:hypothetical protein
MMLFAYAFLSRKPDNSHFQADSKEIMETIRVTKFSTVLFPRKTQTELYFLSDYLHFLRFYE